MREPEEPPSGMASLRDAVEGVTRILDNGRGFGYDENVLREAGRAPLRSMLRA